ncbi:hypothetical protein KK083_00795 [Fulvivirgaceae bacterium PWU4]|uniref:DUF6705 domain-containing protein n=1 Tax=Chryseosolibacter histidini TaxID=2782349 RepID=A0AAP2GGX3_9BACT|nr:DUF6705 family protein [Chryseosolibacter histidini]MBT1695391.1 hypothetical protein [Chryseosolibacter histidini]
MKYILVLVLFISLVDSWAQEPKKGDYVTDTALDKFAGTWQGTQGGQSLKLVLKKEKVYFKGFDYSRDLLIGWHELTINGQVVESTLSFAGGPYDKNVTILGSSEGQVQVNLTTFRDLSRERNHAGTLLLQDPNVIRLTLRLTEHVILNKKKQDPVNALTVPGEWILKKVD